jgi:hypothetical protein
MTVVNSNTWSTRSLNAFNNTYALPSQNAAFWSPFILDNGIQDQGIYEFDIRFLERGRQRFSTSSDDAGQFYIDGEYLGNLGASNDIKILTTTKYYDTGDIARITIIRTDEGVQPSVVACRWTSSQYSPVSIADFSAAPRVLTNSTNTTLLWTVNNAKKIEINQNVGDVTNLTQIPIDVKLQSVVGSFSPASKIYTLTAFGEVSTDILTATSEVLVFNDRTPSNINIPNFYNREPNEIIEYSLSPIAGIDAPITVTGDDFVLVAAGLSSSFTKSITVVANDVIKLKFPAPGFSQDPNTLDNTREYYVDFGTIRKYFNVTTRAPNDDEIFDFGDIKNSVPFPAPPGNDENPPQYLVSPDTIEPTAEQWQVELNNPNNINLTGGVEIKTTNTDKTEVRVKPLGGAWGNWVTTEYLYDQIANVSPRTLEGMNWNTIQTRTGDINNTQPRSINTRSSGILTAKNIV